jgi:hypothetical protein
MTSKGEVVFVQVSGGSDDTLNPGLNIMGGVQPRGLSEFIPGISGTPEDAGKVEWSIDMMSDGCNVTGLTGESMVMSCISRPFNMSILDISDMYRISEVLADAPSALVLF